MNRPWPSGSTSKASSPRRAAIRYDVRDFRVFTSIHSWIASTWGSERIASAWQASTITRRSRAFSRIRFSATTEYGSTASGSSGASAGGAAPRAATTMGASAGNGNLGKSRQKRLALKTPVWPARKTTTLSWGLFRTAAAISLKASSIFSGVTSSSARKHRIPGFARGIESPGAQDLADPRCVGPGILELSLLVCSCPRPGPRCGAGWGPSTRRR